MISWKGTNNMAAGHINHAGSWETMWMTGTLKAILLMAFVAVTLAATVLWGG